MDSAVVGRVTPDGLIHTVAGNLAAGSVAPKPLLPVAVEIGGMPAVVQYAGGASGLVAGVMQVNAVVPAGVTSGSAVPVTIKVGTSSQAGVTLAVKRVM